MLRSVVKVYVREHSGGERFVGYLDEGYVAREPSEKDITIDSVQNLPDTAAITGVYGDTELIHKTELTFVPAFITVDDAEVFCA